MPSAQMPVTETKEQFGEKNPVSTKALLKTSKVLRSSDGEIVRHIDDVNTRWLAAEAPARERLFEALGVFLDVEGGAWPSKERSQLIQQGRHPTSINIAYQKHQSLAGSIYAEKWDFDFSPQDVEESSLTKGVKHWYYKDKERFNYGLSERKCLERGLIHRGDEAMEIDYDLQRTNGRGGIAFKTRLPGSVSYDPYWQTDSVWDCKQAIERFWMTPQDIVRTFDTNDAQVLNAALIDEQGFYSYETNDLETWENPPRRWGSKELVLQHRLLEEVKTTRLHAHLGDGQWLEFPVGVDEDSVRRAISEFQLRAEDIKEFPYDDRILYLTIVCPNLSRSAVLFQGRHDVQCGMIGLFPFSSTREMGIDKGMMESIVDLQRTLQYRESKKDDIIASMVSNAMAVNVNALPNREKDVANIKQNASSPGFTIGVNGNPKDVMAPLPHKEVPQAIWNDINVLVDMFDRVSPVTPALEGSGSSGESGILFEMRHAVTKLGTLILFDNWQQHMMNKAEAWYNQAAITYPGHYRKIRTEDGGEVEFNKPVFRNGERLVLNDMSELPRSKVVISLKKSSPTERFSERLQAFDMTKILSAHPELFQDEIRVLTNRMFNTMEWSPEDRIKINTLNQMKEMKDILNIITQIKQMKASGLNAEVMMAQAEQMLAQMGKAQGGQGVPESVSAPRPQVPPAPQGGAPEMDAGAPPDAGPMDVSEPGAPVQTSRGEFQP